jgi:hypothetical protein
MEGYAGGEASGTTPSTPDLQHIPRLTLEDVMRHVEVCT